MGANIDFSDFPDLLPRYAGDGLYSAERLCYNDEERAHYANLLRESGDLMNLSLAKDKPTITMRTVCVRTVCSLAAMLLSACAPSVEENLDRLSRGGAEAEEAKIALLVANQLPVEPLLTVLEDPGNRGRLELVEVLASVIMRQEDPRLRQVLEQRLRHDSDPQLRARIIYELGIRHHTELLDDFLLALRDADDEVRLQAVVALRQLRDKLSAAQDDSLRQWVGPLIADENEETQLQASFLIGEYVSEWVDEARKLALKGQLAAAESLFFQALDYYPASKKAIYRLGRHYFDNGQQERGLQVLRQNSMLLDVPRFAEAPNIDGLLDEKIWQTAATFDTLYVNVVERILVTRPSPVQTKVYLGYTPDAVYMGAYCHDTQPEELVVESRGSGDHPESDQVEFLFDGNFDYSTFGQIVLNTTGVVAEGWWTRTPMRRFDGSWEPAVEGAAFVGEDFWSVECRIPYGQQGFPEARPGDIWGFNFVRLYRALDYSQWVVDIRDGSWPADKLGFLQFE